MEVRRHTQVGFAANMVLLSRLVPRSNARGGPEDPPLPTCKGPRTNAALLVDPAQPFLSLAPALDGPAGAATPKRGRIRGGRSSGSAVVRSGATGRFGAIPKPIRGRRQYH